MLGHANDLVDAQPNSLMELAFPLETCEILKKILPEDPELREGWGLTGNFPSPWTSVLLQLFHFFHQFGAEVSVSRLI